MDILTQLRAERGKVTRPFKCRAPRFSPEVEDQDSGNLTLNHISVEDRFHQPSIRPSTSTGIFYANIPPYAGCESAQSTTCGLACADQGQPRAALDRRKIKPTLDVKVNQIIARHCSKARAKS